MDQAALEQVVADKVAEKEALNRRIETAHKLCFDNVGLLLQLTPDHDRTSCSDENPNNQGRCKRCTLMQMELENWNDDWTVEIQLTQRSTVEIDENEIRRQIQNL